MVLAGVALLVSSYFLIVRPLETDARASSQQTGGSGGRGGTLSGQAPSLAGSAEVVGRKLDCAHPTGDVARVGDSTISAVRLCDWLGKTGGANPAVALERMIDGVLVSRALAAANAQVIEPEVDAGLKALAVDGDAALVREQLRERLELTKLAALRAPVAVTEAEVDAELAAGAPGIDRGQGVRVEGWVARVAPGADDAANAKAEQAANDFVAALGKENPADAAKRLGLAPLPRFVLGQTGLEPELEAAGLALAIGQTSGAIQTRVGWTVIRALEQVEGTKLDDKGLRARVRRALETRKGAAAGKQALAELRATTPIEILVVL